MNNMKNYSAAPTLQIANGQFAILTQELLVNYGRHDLQSSVNHLLLGWISIPDFEIHNTLKAETIDFFTKSWMLLEKIEHNTTNDVAIGLLEFYETLNADFKHSKKCVKMYFDQTQTSFLMSDFANSNECRRDVLYQISLFKDYMGKVFKLKKTYLKLIK